MRYRARSNSDFYPFRLHPMETAQRKAGFRVLGFLFFMNILNILHQHRILKNKITSCANNLFLKQLHHPVILIPARAGRRIFCACRTNYPIPLRK